jgi:hypothetical protein
MDHGFLGRYLFGAYETTSQALAENSEGLQLFKRWDHLIRCGILPSLSELQKPDVVVLALHAHLTWVGACKMALAGHPAAVFPLARSALEAACYAHIVSRSNDAANAWRDRQIDRRQRRKYFDSAVKQVRADIMLRDSKFGDLLLELYDKTIDYGAHPNVDGVLPYSELIVEDGGEYAELKLHGLYDFGSPAMNHGLFACIDTAFVFGRVLVDIPDSISQSVCDEMSSLLDARPKSFR